MASDIAQALAIDALWTLNGVCSQIGDDHLELPTPCAGWDLRTLLEHITGQHHGIAATLSGSGHDLADWHPLPVGEDRAALFTSIREVRLALLSATEDTAWMPELLPETPLPTAQVLRAHLVDTVAHAWDVAATIGVTIEFSEPVLAEAYEVARSIPDGVQRDHPGTAFAHRLSGAERPSLAGYLALLGRNIDWSASGR